MSGAKPQIKALKVGDSACVTNEFAEKFSGQNFKFSGEVKILSINRRKIAEVKVIKTNEIGYIYLRYLTHPESLNKYNPNGNK